MLLDEQFDKFYLDNQLAEKGRFRKGKKVGIWKTWHPNGVLSSQSEWAGGQKNGYFYSYNDKGNPVEKGLYRVNKKQGKWINFISKDTIKYYNNLPVVKKSEKDKKEAVIIPDSKKEVIKGKESTQMNTFSKTKIVKDSKDSKKTEKKAGFFKRLFSKKRKSKPTNAKSS